MNNEYLPSALEVRQRIEQIPDGELTVSIGRKRPYKVDLEGEQVRLGLMYSYLIAGRNVEAFGKYGPRGIHAVKVKLDGAEAVLFPAKTAKRKTKKGWTLRPVLLPSDPALEPWAQPVYDYIKKAGEDYPFQLHPNWLVSQRYIQAAMEDIFDGLNWRFVNYTRSAYAHPDLGYPPPDPQSRKRKNIKEEEFNRLGSQVSYDRVEGWTPITVSIEDRWKPFRSHELRKRRVQDLELYYRFDSTDLCYYGGWEPKDRGAAMRHYLELDLDENPENIRIMVQMAQRYFKKLLIPVTSVLYPEEATTGGIEIIG